MKEKMVQVAKGKKIPRSEEKKMEKKAGSSNTGKYKSVSPSEFAGKSGGSSPYSFPINTESRAKSALKLAHNAPNPSGIRAAVHKKYPDLGKKSGKK